MMKAKLGKVVLFLLGLIILQQGIALGNHRVSQLEKQSAVVADHDLDPSALFYTEVTQALQAERAVRSKIGK